MPLFINSRACWTFANRHCWSLKLFQTRHKATIMQMP